MKNMLFWVVTQQVVVISYQCLINKKLPLLAA